MKKTAFWLVVALSILWTGGSALAFEGPGGLAEIKLYRGEFTEVEDQTELYVDYVCTGTVDVWNTRTKLQVRVVPNNVDNEEVWKIKTVHAYVGADPVPVDAAGQPLLDQFPYTATYGTPTGIHSIVLDLEADMGFHWGQPWEPLRSQNICVHAVLERVDPVTGQLLEKKDVWTFDPDFEAELDNGFEYDTITIGHGRLQQSHRVKKGKAVRNRVRIMRGVLNQALAAHWGSTVYEMAHPRRAHFIDSPVAGLGFETPTHQGKTDDAGAFDYFPGERVDLMLGDTFLGDALVDHKISPVDMFEGGDMDDNRVANMAWLLQSLDADGDPSKGIGITDPVVENFEATLDDMGVSVLDFDDDAMVEAAIDGTIARSASDPTLINMTKVSKDEAQQHLGKTTSTDMFRKNVAKTPELASAKAKLNVMGVWFQAKKANGELATFSDDNGVTVEGVPYYYYDEETGTSQLLRFATEAKPLVCVYTDEAEGYGAADVWAAVSRDDGNTWKRKNISRMADRSSFQLANGEEYYGHCKKPVFQVKGNKILIAWTSKFAKGGKPRYSIQVCPDEDGDGVPDPCETCHGDGDNEECGPDYTPDDPYVVDDFWGVSGPQRSVDYTDQGYPEVGEVPYSAVWTCRGVIVTQAEIDKGGFFADKPIGDIVWYKPERLTSARRDANQVFMGGADSAGFAIAWQEDPKGLRPGEAKGPGPGWGGATANHKTDIWYSYITWADHSVIDEDFVAGGDPNHPVQYDEDGNEVPWTNRPKALVPMALPVRISDNDAVNTNNADLVDDEGNPITAVTAEDIVVQPENLTRCVKFIGGNSMVTPDDPDAAAADYAVLRDVPDNHNSSMNCTNCHVPFGNEPMGENPTQAAPIPLVVVDAEANEYLGGFTNSDCLSCHYNNVVPRDRLIAVAPGLDEAAKCDECESKGGIWMDGSDGGAIVEAYYPYEPYPFIMPDVDDTKDGSHRYITEVSGLWSYTNEFSPDGIGLYTKTNYQGAERTVAITTDGRLLDGNTSATRPNLFLQTYTKPDGSKSAWAIMAYEETKGLGSGPPETTGTGEQPQDGSGYDPYEAFPDNGKNAIYHSFDFQNPDLVSGGTILNLPETDDDGNVLYVSETEYSGSNPIYDGEGNITGYDPIPNPDYDPTNPESNYILDWKGEPQPAYENARRPRFILQSKSAAFGGTTPDGSFKAPNNSGTVLLVLYKEGEDGAGRPTDIMARRCVVKDADGNILTGNPWAPKNFLPGAQNLSTVMPGTTWINPDRDESAKGDGVKVCDWTQPKECLDWKSGVNPYEDARAHRGAIRGDFVILGYSYCPNWAASRKAHDKYDFYIRRSFNGGATWTTDPAATAPIVHTDYFINPDGISGSELSELGDDESEATKHYTVETSYPEEGGAYGDYEPARNLSLIKNNKVSVIEPRIVAVPGTIKKSGVWTGIDEDKQNPNCFYIAYGTSTNLPDVEKAPEDLFLSYSQDRGNTLAEDTWVVNPDSSGNNAGLTVSGWYRLAKGDPEQGEVQIRMTPNAERFYSVWLEEGEEGSDIFFRRMMPTEFDANVIAPAEEPTDPVTAP